MSTITMPWTNLSSNILCKCNNTPSTIIHIQFPDFSAIKFSHQPFYTCNICHDFVKRVTIPQIFTKHNIFVNYSYHGTSTEYILSNPNKYSDRNHLDHIPYIYDKTLGTFPTPVSLTCCHCSNYIALVQNSIYVPVFISKRLKRRNTPIIKYYELKQLYIDNPYIIGYYEINIDSYNNSTELDKIKDINNKLFTLFLNYNMIAKQIIKSQYDSFFSLIPIELIHKILYMSFRNSV